LGDERFNLTSFQAFHESGRRVEADELLAARQVILLERTQHACAAIKIATEQKSTSLAKRAEASYAEYRRQKASPH
jgi:hypothetical protein